MQNQKLVDLPWGNKVLEKKKKWILKRKYKVDGSIDMYEARLVAKWFKQNGKFGFIEYNKLDKSDFSDCCATKSRSKPNGCKK